MNGIKEIVPRGGARACARVRVNKVDSAGFWKKIARDPYRRTHTGNRHRRDYNSINRSQFKRAAYTHASR